MALVNTMVNTLVKIMVNMGKPLYSNKKIFKKIKKKKNIKNGKKPFYCQIPIL